MTSFKAFSDLWKKSTWGQVTLRLDAILPSRQSSSHKTNHFDESGLLRGIPTASISETLSEHKSNGTNRFMLVLHLPRENCGFHIEFTRSGDKFVKNMSISCPHTDIEKHWESDEETCVNLMQTVDTTVHPLRVRSHSVCNLRCFCSVKNRGAFKLYNKDGEILTMDIQEPCQQKKSGDSLAGS